MDAMAQANGIDKTQLSKGHRKQLEKRTWKLEHISNLLYEMDERAQLNKNGSQDDTFWLREFRDNSIMTRTHICSLKVTTTASWSNGSCNGPTAPFKTIRTQSFGSLGSFGNLEVSHKLSEPPRRTPDA